MAEINEIFLIVEQFCIDNCIVILACTNALALILAICCLVKLSRKKQTGIDRSEMEDLMLNLNIEKAEVNIARVNKEFEDKLTSEDAAQSAQEGATAEGADISSDAVVIEKLIPIESDKMEPAGFCTSKSGRIYSEEEIQSKIKD